MFKAIKKLQKEPESKRRRIAFFTALIITLIVIGVWALSLPSKFEGQGQENVASGIGPIESFFNLISSSFETLKEGF